MNILLVEDDDATVESIHLCFQLFFPEANLIPARLGHEALNVLATIPITAVLVDMGLPDIDGIELLRKIREISTVPVLVVSARRNQEIMAEAERLGAREYIAKPFKSREKKRGD